MLFSSADAQVVPSVPGRGDADWSKRRKIVSYSPSPTLDPTPAPKPMPLTAMFSGSLSRCVASIERSPSPLNSDSRITSGSPIFSLQHLEKGSDNGAHPFSIVDELLQSKRQSVTSIERQGDQDIYARVDKPSAYGKDRGNNGGAEEDHSGERSHMDVINRSLPETSRRSRYQGLPVHVKDKRPAQPSLRYFRRARLPASTLPGIALPQVHHPSNPRAENAFQTCSPERQPTNSKVGRSHDQKGAQIAYQITDLTHIQVPKGSSVVTMVVQSNESNLPLYPTALHHELFGGEGKVIRVTQLSLDSWMLVGYQSDSVAPSARSRESLTSPKIGRTSVSLGDSARVDNDGSSDEDEDEAYEADYVARTRAPWSKSDEQRLLSLRDKSCMEWGDVFDRFPNRTPGAVKVRYYALRKRKSRKALS